MDRGSVWVRTMVCARICAVLLSVIFQQINKPTDLVPDPDTGTLNFQNSVAFFLMILPYLPDEFQRDIANVNVTFGEKVERAMMTGVHVVVDIFCVCCGSIVGWRYEMAYEKNQKYKEGKFVLERFKISGPDGSHYCVTHEAYSGGSDDDDI